VLLLKGLSLMLSTYKDRGLRYMSDIDILVPESSANSVIEQLKKEGYATIPSSISSYNRVWHAATLQDTTGTQVDIHWQALHIVGNPGLTDEFWKHSMVTDFEGHAVRVLDPTSQLIHICIHGFSWSEQRSIRWVADAHALLTSVENNIDWNRLVAIAREYRLSVILGKTLGYLGTQFELPIPPIVLDRLASIANPSWEEKESELRSYPTGIVSRARIIYYMYRRAKESPRNASMSFYRYLSHYRQLPSTYRLPREIGVWFFKKMLQKMNTKN